MSLINECLERILSARYGKDVRQAIHDSIQEIDSVARTAKDSATSASQTAIAQAGMAVSASQTAIQKAEESLAASEQAKTYAENAAAVTGVEIATKDRAGLVKGGDNYIAEDGTLTLTMETTEKILQNSHTGGIKVEEIGGKSEQNGVPTPNTSVEIKKVVLTGAKSIGGNNLFNDIGWFKENDFAAQRDGSWLGTSLSKVCFKNTFKKSGSMYLSITARAEEAEFPVNLKIHYTDGTTENALGLPLMSDFMEIKSVTDPVKTVDYIEWTYDTAGEFYVKGVMFSFIDCDYEPYKGMSITFSNPITLNGIDDAQDFIVRKDGTIGTDRELKEYVFDGSDDESWKASSTRGVFYLSLADARVRASTQNYALCDAYIYDGSTNAGMEDMTFKIGTTTASPTRSLINIKNLSCETLEQFKAQLQSNPITVCYPLEGAVFEPLPTADQIALNSLLSFDGTTYLYFDSEIEPTSLVEYGTSHVGALTLETWNKAENNRIRTEELATALQMMNQG